MSANMFLIAGVIGFTAVIAILVYRACSLLNERYDADSGWED